MDSSRWEGLPRYPIIGTIDEMFMESLEASMNQNLSIHQGFYILSTQDSWAVEWKYSQKCQPRLTVDKTKFNLVLSDLVKSFCASDVVWELQNVAHRRVKCWNDKTTFFFF